MLYQIIIKGTLDNTWSNWLGEVNLNHSQDENGNPITRLSVDLTDQPALFGVLDHLRDLNLTLISVQQQDETRS